jgi:Barstar (barnase inhibitor)
MSVIPPRPTKRDTIQAIYDAVRAPNWAAPNLDALADILRDLSWLPPGPVNLEWQVAPDLPAPDVDAIHDVLIAAVAESARSAHPLTLRVMA